MRRRVRLEHQREDAGSLQSGEQASFDNQLADTQVIPERHHELLTESFPSRLSRCAEAGAT
jgi:hypothetical protein